MNSTQKRAAKKTSASQGKSYDGFTAEERGAMKERARELKAAESGAKAEAAVLEKIAEMPEAERVMAERGFRWRRPAMR
jgi:hypothetical protein